MRCVDAVLLGQQELANAIARAHPLSESTQRPLDRPGLRSIRDRVDYARANGRVLARLREARERLDEHLSGPERIAVENALHRRAERLAEPYAVAHRRRHAMVAQHDQVVATTAGRLRHALDLANASIGAAQVREGEPARGPEVMRQLVVLHERAVDDRHAKVHVEQDRDRLKLSHDDVREDAQEREDPFRMRYASHPFAARTLPLLAEPLADTLEHHP